MLNNPSALGRQDVAVMITPNTTSLTIPSPSGKLGGFIEVRLAD